MKTCITAKNVPPALGPYHHAVEANGFVFVSGQLGIDPETGKLQEGVEAQARQAFQNAQMILQAAGCSLLDVVKTTVFLQDMNDFTAINKIYEEEMQKDFPARSCFQVAKLPAGALFEIELIAAKP